MWGTVLTLKNTHAYFSWVLAYKSLLFILGKRPVTHRKIFLHSPFIKQKKEKCFSSRSKSYSSVLLFKNAIIKVIVSELVWSRFSSKLLKVKTALSVKSWFFDFFFQITFLKTATLNRTVTFPWGEKKKVGFHLFVLIEKSNFVCVCVCACVKRVINHT